MSVDKEMVELVKSIAEAVRGLPEAVQARAFDVLLEHRLGAAQKPSVAQPAVAPGGPPVEAPSPEADWSAHLAQAGGVRPEQVQYLLSMDDEGLNVITPELGDGEAERNRNVAVLLVWAARVLNRDIYYPSTEVRRVLRALGLNFGNLYNNLKAESCLRTVKIRGQSMLQLTRDWNQRVRDIFDRFTR